MTFEKQIGYRNKEHALNECTRRAEATNDGLTGSFGKVCCLHASTITRIPGCMATMTNCMDPAGGGGFRVTLVKLLMGRVPSSWGVDGEHCPRIQIDVMKDVARRLEGVFGKEKKVFFFLRKNFAKGFLMEGWGAGHQMYGEFSFDFLCSVLFHPFPPFPLFPIPSPPPIILCYIHVVNNI